MPDDAVTTKPIPPAPTVVDDRLTCWAEVNGCRMTNPKTAATMANAIRTIAASSP